MYAVEVVPIQRGLLRGSLSFFSKVSVLPGSLVSAPVRNKMVPAVVLTCRDVRDEKLDLKSSGFSLKKLGTAEPRLLFRESLIDALRDTARFYSAPVGATLAELTFSALLASPRSLESPAPRARSVTISEVLVLQAEAREREHAYKNLVREAFARQKSVVVVCPTLVEVDRVTSQLSRGIEERVVVVSSLLSPREMKRAWNRVATESALLIIGTPSLITFPFSDVDALVFERESARAFVTRSRPYLDLRAAGERVAASLGARFVLADFPVRVETYARLISGQYEDAARPQARTQSPARVSVVDVRKIDTIKNERRSFAALQPSTYEALSDVLSRGGRAVVYAARKGIAPMTVCNDCGTPITDSTTDTPMVLHKTPRGNVFMSHRSGAVEAAERSCAVCGGWNLVSLGIGVDRVEDEIGKKLGVRTFTFTNDSVPTHKVAQKLIHAFNETAGAVIVGTERMLPYIPHVPLSVVASIDSLLSLPAWRADERALSTLFSLLEKTDERLIIETRRPESRVMRAVALGGPMDFLRDELKERHTYAYPPYALFIGLTWMGTEARTIERRALVVETFKNYELVGPLPPESQGRGQYRERAVLRLDPARWPDDELGTLINGLPDDVLVTIDPDDIV